jgi:hypothetical protein
MKLFIIFALFTSCLSTPVEQGRQFRDETRSSDGTVVGKYGYQDPSGALRIVKYTAGKDGFVAAGDGVPVIAQAPGQPLVWTGEQPIIVEPAPLAYGSKQVKTGQVLSAQDQQRYLTTEEEIEAREEGQDSEPKADVDSKVDEDSKTPETHLPLAETLSNTPVKSPKKQSAQSLGVQDSEQTFPQVLSGQRRLVEHVAGVKGKVTHQSSGVISPAGKQYTVYQSVQHAVPVHVQEIVRVPFSHSVPRVQNQVISGLKKPVVQYQISPQNFFHQQLLSPVNRKQVQILHSGIQQPIIGDQRQIQYVLQPVIHQNLGVDQRQFSVQPELQQILGFGQSNVQALSGVKGYGVDQRQFSVQPELQQILGFGQSNVQALSGVKGYGVDQRQFSVQPELQQFLGFGQSNVQALTGVKGYGVDQRPVVDQRYLSVAQGVQQVGNFEDRHDVDQKEVGIVAGVQQPGLQQPGVQQPGVQQPGVQQVGVGVDHRQVQVLSGVQDIGKSQVVNQRHVVIRPEVVQQVGGLTDQRGVHLVQSGAHDVGGVDHSVQHLVKPESVVSVQQQRVNPLVGVQYVIPTERRNAVSQEGFVVQQSPQIQVPNQAVVVSPWISQYGYQLRQPAIQHQHQLVSQQVPVSNLQEYYHSIRDSPVSQVGQISQPNENQYYSQIGQWPSIVQPIQYSGIESDQESIRRDDIEVGIERQPDIGVRTIVVGQRPGLYAQNYGTKAINV